jgi:hypothetical protein
MPSHFELAQSSDDPDLRRLLRENPFAGSISVSFEREPNYFSASAIEGDFTQTLLVRDSQTNQIIGVGDRSIRPYYVNGKIMEVGYFSGLRIDAKYQHGMALARFLSKGFEGQRELHKDGRAKFYLMSIVADNNPAKRLLDSNLPHYPRLQPYARMFTFAIHPRHAKRESKIKVTRGSADLIPAIADCLTRNGLRAQFAPCWTEDALRFTLKAHLAIEDFFLARNESRVTGCLALWDQQPFKQSVIRGYSGSMARYRKIINLFTPLPEIGTRLNQCFACFAAIDNDDSEIFSALLRALYNEAARRKYDYVMLGLADRNPFIPIAKSYRPIVYVSNLHLVAWEDGYEEVANIDKRPPALEIALL